MSDIQLPSSSRRQPLEDIRILIGRMDGKLDIMVSTVSDHGKRISDLEAWKNRAIGWVIGGGLVAGAVSDGLISLLTK